MELRESYMCSSNCNHRGPECDKYKELCANTQTEAGSQVLQAFTCWMCLVRFIFLCRILMHFLYLLFLFYLKFSLNLQPRVQAANTGNKKVCRNKQTQVTPLTACEVWPVNTSRHSSLLRNSNATEQN